MKTLNSLSSFIKRTRLSSRIDPERDWLILITATLILLAGIVVWNAWAFDTVANGGSIGRPATSTPPVFNQASLDGIHAIFSARAAEEAKYASGEYQYVDPSQ
ncbi:MAG: hypothetical protein ACYC1Y_01605 [Minisyncoccota bacterium]